MLYIKCVRNGTDSYSSHDGMSVSTVEALLMNLGATGIQVITEDAWKAANPPRP
jgi:hypothetical protein